MAVAVKAYERSPFLSTLVVQGNTDEMLDIARDFIVEFENDPGRWTKAEREWYIAHWTLLDWLECGLISQKDYAFHEMRVDEHAFVDFLRCLNGFDCECP